MCVRLPLETHPTLTVVNPSPPYIYSQTCSDALLCSSADGTLDEAGARVLNPPQFLRLPEEDIPDQGVSESWAGVGARLDVD